jgi:hypothetical protein
MGVHRRSFAGVVLLFVAAAVALPAGTPPAARGAADAPATPRAVCGPGSMPETAEQGRVTKADVDSGRAAKGYTCNTELVGHVGDSGGYRVHRYVDAAGHECAFFDTTLLFPTNATHGPQSPTGVWAVDMADPAHPVHTATLSTIAMQTPHESFSINTKRGLLGAVMGNPATYPGAVDLYDISKDCRNPALQSTLPLSALGHEGAFSPDGNTFWATSVVGWTTAIDVTNPMVPVPLFESTAWSPHGLNVSDDGNRVYFADLGSRGNALSPPGTDGTAGVTILDVSEVQARKPQPKVTVLSHLTWPSVSIPQTPIPVTITTGTPPQPHHYLVEVDEFSKSTSAYAATDPVGAARIIDIDDDRHPKVVSDLRLEVNSATARAGDQQNDPGATSGLKGYAAHYCAVPQRAEPGIVACSFILSGLRIFDIRDPAAPKELAYFNAPTKPGVDGAPGTEYAMSAAAFVPERGEIWYSDGNSGMWVLRVTNGAWPFGSPVAASTSGAGGSATVSSAAPGARVAPASRTLPATGSRFPAATIGLVLLAAALSLVPAVRFSRRTAR